jgi:hypothetical protein
MMMTNEQDEILSQDGELQLKDLDFVEPDKEKAVESLPAALCDEALL